jgi:acyl-CoA dehydrogenase
MLMECLSTGRAISLPAIGTVSIKQSLRTTSAYARIRRQFNIAVGTMEGVAAPLSRMVRSAYTFEAARGLTASMVDEGRKAEDGPLVDAIARDRIHAIEQSFAAVFANFPNPVLGALMRVLVFPLGRHARPAADRECYRLARAVLRPGAYSDRLTRGVYVTTDPKDPTGMLEDALIKVTRAEEIETRFLRALKKGVVTRRLDRDAITDAVEANVLSEAEAAVLRLADQATDRAIRVDDFAFDELGTRQARSEPATGRAAE